MKTQPATLTVNSSQQNSNLFSRWNEKSWIRSKPMREDSIIGLPFSPNLVPLASHQAIAQDNLGSESSANISFIVDEVLNDDFWPSAF